jgi:hypothetical protein
VNTFDVAADERGECRVSVASRLEGGQCRGGHAFDHAHPNASRQSLATL